MRIKQWMWVLILGALMGLAGCQSNTVSSEQRALMDAADRAVSEALFDAEVDASTSYNVHKDGFVVIRFGGGVPSDVYTSVVAQLRADERINGVKAEQGGREVCILSHGR